MCIILLSSFLCSVCFSSGPVCSLSGTACRHPAFPWLPSPSHALCGLGNSPFPRVAVFGADLCVYVRMCVLAICMNMSLTQSTCYTSSGTNLSNISYDCVVPQNLEWFMCMCVCMLCATSHHIALLWRCTKPNVSAHLFLCACVFSWLQEADQMPNYM